MTWWEKAGWAAVLLVPCWIAAGFIPKHFGMKAQVFVFWYYLALAVGVAVYTRFTEDDFVAVMFPSSGGVTSSIGMAWCFAVAAHIYLFDAVPMAPNPSFPSLVANGGGGVLVFFGAIALAKLVQAVPFLLERVPSLAEEKQYDWVRALVAILVIVFGLYLLNTSEIKKGDDTPLAPTTAD